MTITTTQDPATVTVDAESLADLTRRITDLIVRAARWIDHDSDEDRQTLTDALYDFVNEDDAFCDLRNAADRAGKAPAPIEILAAEELFFYDDLLSDLAAGKLRGVARFGARDTATGAEAIAVRLGRGTVAIADGARFAPADWEESGRLDAHAADPDDPLDQAAIDQLF